jgi:hypothetical protein
MLCEDGAQSTDSSTRRNESRGLRSRQRNRPRRRSQGTNREAEGVHMDWIKSDISGARNINYTIRLHAGKHK